MNGNTYLNKKILKKNRFCNGMYVISMQSFKSIGLPIYINKYYNKLNVITVLYLLQNMAKCIDLR